MNKFCISISATNSNELRGKLASLEKEHSFFELRLDLLEDLSEEVAKQLLSQTQTDVIATLRTKSEGGEFNGAGESYLAYLKTFFGSPAKFVDVELSQIVQTPAIKSLIEPDRTIISYHNFNQTPNRNELEQIVKQMNSVSENSICKIACMVNASEDLDLLIDLQQSFPPNKAVVIGMGEKGRRLRVDGMSLGAFTSFASSETTPVAPGQLYYKDMQKLLKSVEQNHGR